MPGKVRIVDKATAAAMRARYANRVTYQMIADEYGVSLVTARAVIQRDGAYREDRPVQFIMQAAHDALQGNGNPDLQPVTELIAQRLQETNS